MTFEEWASALAEIESRNNPHAWGDSGLACGRWQMHPAFYHDWFLSTLGVEDSWDTVFSRALERFYQHYTERDPSPVRAAMIFHLGAHAVIDLHRWDDEYERRFRAAAGI